MKKGNIRKMFSMLLSFVLVFSMSFAVIPKEVKAVDGVVFAINADKNELHRGDTVNVTVSMSGNTTGTGLTYKFYYDQDKLELVSAKKGDAFIFDDAEEATNVGELKKNPKGEENSVRAVIGRDQKSIINGSLMIVTFRVKDTAKGAVEFSSKADLITPDYKPIASTITDNTKGLTVNVPVTGISLDKNTLSLAKGNTGKLTATLMPEDAESSIAWNSDKTSVVTVGEDGTVTAVGVGNATVTATAGGFCASCTVTVNNPLNGITIKGDVSTLRKGQTTQLKVEYDPADTTDSKDVIWTSDKESVATVDLRGVVKAIADGEAVITAKVGEKTATYTITVKEVKITGISVKPETKIHKGESETLVVTYDPADTTDDRTVEWTSSDNSIATVDGSGKVTAVAVGGANITAKVGNLTAVCAVTVDAPLTAIVPKQPSINMVKNQTAIIKYTVEPADTTDSKEVIFESSSPEIVEVDENGELTAKKAGEAIITLSGINGITAQITVTVTEIQIDSVVINKQSAVVEKGQSIELIATVGPNDNTDDNQTITWTSSDESIIIVSPTTSESSAKVTVTATEKGGNAVVTAKTWNGKEATCTITVPIHIERIETPVEKVMLRGETTVLDVKYYPENTTDEREVTWTSDNENVATVDAGTGKITAIKEGEANITATTNNAVTAATKVTVTENHLNQDIAEEIKFAEMKKPVFAGQRLDVYSQLNLNSIVENNNITDNILVSWTSSDESVAVVDQSGMLTAIKPGKVTIKATIVAKNGAGQVVGTYEVDTEVEVSTIPLESIAFNKVISEMQVGATETLTIIYNPENTTDAKDVEWTSSDSNILSVENGKITALKVGTAEITAKVGEKTVSCKITVKPMKENPGKGTTGKTDKTNKVDKANKGIKTGDTSNVALYVVLMLVSLVTILFYQRKRHSVRR